MVAAFVSIRDSRTSLPLNRELPLRSSLGECRGRYQNRPIDGKDLGCLLDDVIDSFHHSSAATQILCHSGPEQLSEIDPMHNLGVQTAEQDDADRNQFVGEDGLLVRVGQAWSPENMRLEPQERRR
jgi:hypothetical protein